MFHVILHFQIKPNDTIFVLKISKSSTTFTIASYKSGKSIYVDDHVLVNTHICYVNLFSSQIDHTAFEERKSIYNETVYLLKEANSGVPRMQ